MYSFNDKAEFSAAITNKSIISLKKTYWSQTFLTVVYVSLLIHMSLILPSINPSSLPPKESRFLLTSFSSENHSI